MIGVATCSSRSELRDPQATENDRALHLRANDVGARLRPAGCGRRREKPTTYGVRTRARSRARLANNHAPDGNLAARRVGRASRATVVTAAPSVLITRGGGAHVGASGMVSGAASSGVPVRRWARLVVVFPWQARRTHPTAGYARGAGSRVHEVGLGHRRSPSKISRSSVTSPCAPASGRLTS